MEEERSHGARMRRTLKTLDSHLDGEGEELFMAAAVSGGGTNEIESELAGSSVSIYTTSLSPLAHYEEAEDGDGGDGRRKEERGFSSSRAEASEFQDLDAGKEQDQGRHGRRTYSRHISEDSEFIDIVDDDDNNNRIDHSLGASLPATSRQLGQDASDFRSTSRSLRQDEVLYRQHHGYEDDLETAVLRRQVDQLRRDNARYRRYEEQAIRVKEQLDMKDELLSRLTGRSERLVADLEEQLRASRMREDRTAREVASLRHELERVIVKLQLAEDLVREQEEEMQKLREDRFAVLKRLEDAIRRHHHQHRPSSPPETSRVEAPSGPHPYDEEELWARLNQLEESNDSLQGEVSSLRRENKRLESHVHLLARLRDLDDGPVDLPPPPARARGEGGKDHDREGDQKLAGRNKNNNQQQQQQAPGLPSSPPPPSWHQSPHGPEDPWSAKKHMVHNSDGVRSAFQYPDVPDTEEIRKRKLQQHHQQPPVPPPAGSPTRASTFSPPPSRALPTTAPRAHVGFQAEGEDEVMGDDNMENQNRHPPSWRYNGAGAPPHFPSTRSSSPPLPSHAPTDLPRSSSPPRSPPQGNIVGHGGLYYHNDNPISMPREFDERKPRPGSPEYSVPVHRQRGVDGSHHYQSQHPGPASPYNEPPTSPGSPSLLSPPGPGAREGGRDDIRVWRDHHHLQPPSQEQMEPLLLPTPRRKKGHNGGGDDLPPYATETSTRRLNDYAPLDQQLMALNLERSQLQAEMDKLHYKQVRTIRDRERTAFVEGRLAAIGKEASHLKLKLKSVPA